MLVYNKSLDVNHTFLRFLSVLTSVKVISIETERLRIFDFIVSNPVHISRMSLGSELIKERNKFKAYQNRYQVYEPRSMFESMKPIQDAVMGKLKEIGVLSTIENSTRLRVELESVPKEILSIINDQNNSISKDVLAFINSYLVEYTLVGDRGLKSASKLMEYRYDAA